MLPALDAMESTTAANRIGVGAGLMDASAREGVVRGWTHAIEAVRPPAPVVKATPDMLRRDGIKVVRVKKARPE